MPEPKTYADIRKAECVHCAAGIEFYEKGKSHDVPYPGEIVKCTAPTPEAVIERLLGRLEAAEKIIECHRGYAVLSHSQMVLAALKGEG